MKKLLTSIVLMLCPIASLAQTKTVPTKAPTVEELQAKLDMQAIDVALSNYQLAAMQIQQQAEKQLEPLRSAVSAAVMKAKAERGLDDTYDYDPQKKEFVKRTPPPTANAPASSEPAPVVRPPAVKPKPLETPKKP